MMEADLAKSVLCQLRSPALKDLSSKWYFDKDFKRVACTIETILCFIHDADRKQRERAVKVLLSRLREVLYEADDLLDAIAARALRKKAIDGGEFKKKVTLFFSKFNHLDFFIRTAHAMKDIYESLHRIEHAMWMFQFQQLTHEPHSVLERRETHPFVDTSEVIGRDQEKKDIISLLLDADNSQQRLQVISVIGFGGLGKTTLAQIVYNDKKVQKGFDVCIWACINYFNDFSSVLVKILTSATKSEPKYLGIDQMQYMLSREIEGRKYLIVLDDVWDQNPSNWKCLEQVLMCGREGSKVLITTRKARVAQCLDAFEYKLGILSEESAWSLFVKITFKDGEFVGDSELDSLGKLIVHKCGYVPLYVTEIGRVLRYRKKEKEEWLSFLKNEFAELAADDTDDGNMMQVLKDSFYDLPGELKRCFAYCSIFPKDWDIEKDELVYMWIAEGLIWPDDEKSLMEIGNDYFFYLVDACLFQEVKKNESNFGVVKYTCKMHCLLHDLAAEVSGPLSTYSVGEDCRDMLEKNGVLYHMM